MSLELVASLLNKIWLSKNKWKHYFWTKFKLLPKFACTWGVRNQVIIFRLSLVTNLVTYFPRLASQSPIRNFWTSQSFGAKLKMATSSKQLLASNICRNHLNMSKLKVWKKKKKIINTHDWIKTEASPRMQEKTILWRNIVGEYARRGTSRRLSAENMQISIYLWIYVLVFTQL